ncbi:MAG: hypothetical protein J0M18_19825 [Ignavibacteria bacterium]|nr:hypothetical protein [Ignavibacteria bacterium]
MKKLFIICLAISAISILSFEETSACPKCNADFKQELMDKRANTLGGQELLEAIKNQDGGNSVVLPKKFAAENDSLSEGMKLIMAENEKEQNEKPGFFESIKIFFVNLFSRS